MGLLSRQPDPEGMGAELGHRPIRSFVNTQNRLIAGGERPVFNDTSRPGNEPPGASLARWYRKPAADAKPEKTPKQIQDGYDSLFQ